MRIGLLSTCYPRHRHDLAGRFVADLAGWLAHAGGHELEVLAPHPAGPDPNPAITVHPLRHTAGPSRLLYGAGAPDNLKHGGLRAAAEVPAFVARLAAECLRRRRGWTHVMSHWLAPCGLVATETRGALPHLAVAHSSDVNLLSRIPGGAAMLARLARGRRTALVLTSEALRPKLAGLARTDRTQRLIDEAPIIRMAINPPPTFESEPLRVPRSALRVLFLGRLVEVKGVDLLIRACASLEDVALTIAGDGPERQSLERLAARTGGQVRFAGEQVGPDKEALLADADALALPSRVLPDGRTDSAPVVLLEAMAAGLPVVATRVGGNAELIRHGDNGLLVPPHQTEPLGQALALLAGDAGLRRRLREAGHGTAAEHTWDRVGPRFEEMLAGL